LICGSLAEHQQAVATLLSPVVDPNTCLASIVQVLYPNEGAKRQYWVTCRQEVVIKDFSECGASTLGVRIINSSHARLTLVKSLIVSNLCRSFGQNLIWMGFYGLTIPLKLLSMNGSKSATGD
jgi:hypothetical protein